MESPIKTTRCSAVFGARNAAFSARYRARFAQSCSCACIRTTSGDGAGFVAWAPATPIAKTIRIVTADPIRPQVVTDTPVPDSIAHAGASDTTYPIGLCNGLLLQSLRHLLLRRRRYTDSISRCETSCLRLVEHHSAWLHRYPHARRVSDAHIQNGLPKSIRSYTSCEPILHHDDRLAY